MRFRCRKCGKVFDEDDAGVRDDGCYEEVWGHSEWCEFGTPLCPECDSDDLDEITWADLIDEEDEEDEVS